MEKQPLALFDFDNTLVKGDSFYRFIRFMTDRKSVILGSVALSPWLAGYACGAVSNHTAKQKVLQWFFTDYHEKVFNERAASFAEKILPGMEKDNAMEAMIKHKEQGHRVIVISASFENYLFPWCEKYGVEGIGTRLEVMNGRLTGKFDSLNCYGPEKLSRLIEVLDTDDYHPVYAYGDSRGDYEMLAIADYPYYRTF